MIMKRFVWILLLTLLVWSHPGFAAEPYPLRVSSDHRHLIDQDGKQFLVQGDAAWSLISALSKEEAEKYLEARRRQGFNAIIVNLIEHHFNGPVDRYGDGPFMTAGDFSSPNEKYFAHAEWIIRKANEKGIVVFLAPIYLGYIGTEEGWIKELTAAGPKKAHNWGRYVGERYGKYANVIWVIGGDRNPDKARESVDAVADGILEVDHHRHLMTAHCHPENSAVDQYREEGWLDLNTTYTYGIVHEKVAVDYRREPLMPFVMIESTYENEHNASPVQVRRQAYWSILGGATGQFFGNMPIWRFDSGWEAALNSTGSNDTIRLGSLFHSRAWHQLIPDEKHEIVVDGLGEFLGLDYLAAARTSDGVTVIAYLPSRRTFTVDLTKISGKAVAAWWFNPSSGKVIFAGQFPTIGKQEFTPAQEGDWVLVLDDADRHLPAPGQLK
jgi:hypothetical protein